MAGMTMRQAVDNVTAVYPEVVPNGPTHMHIGGGMYEFKSMRQLSSQRAFAKAIWAMTGKLPEPVSPREWDKLLNDLGDKFLYADRSQNGAIDEEHTQTE